jgi:hypothetical protein
MDFPWDGALSRAKPAACAASPVDFVAREMTRRHSVFRCPLRFPLSARRIARRDRAMATMRPAFSAALANRR